MSSSKRRHIPRLLLTGTPRQQLPPICRCLARLAVGACSPSLIPFFNYRHRSYNSIAELCASTEKTSKNRYISRWSYASPPPPALDATHGVSSAPPTDIEGSPNGLLHSENRVMAALRSFLNGFRPYHGLGLAAQVLTFNHRQHAPSLGPNPSSTETAWPKSVPTAREHGPKSGGGFGPFFRFHENYTQYNRGRARARPPFTP